MKNAGLKELKKFHGQERFYVHVAAEIKHNFDNRDISRQLPVVRMTCCHIGSTWAMKIVLDDQKAP